LSTWPELTPVDSLNEAHGAGELDGDLSLPRRGGAAVRLAAGKRLLAARRGNFVLATIHLDLASLGPISAD